MKRGKLIIATLLMAFAMSLSTVNAASDDRIMKVDVKVILEKLPLDKQAKMKGFEEMIQRYVDDKTWLETDDIPPFEVSLQLFLENQPSNIEDRYKLTVLLTSSDLRYYDKRAIFPFQEGETIDADTPFTPLTGPIDFYVYLAIAGEVDKLGYLEGQPYFDKARAVMEQGKFSRFVYGWDRREDTMDKVYGANYKVFREMKDFYFYGLSVLQENPKDARENIMKAMKMLKKVRLADRDLEAAKKFIDAHHQEILDIFKDQGTEVVEILRSIDADRVELYDSILNS